MKLIHQNYLLSLLCCFPLNLLAQPKNLYLDPSTATGAVQSQFIEITRFIPLDSSSGQISGSSQLLVTNSYWILYDLVEKKIHLFNKQGNFVQKIDIKKYKDPAISYDARNDVLKLNTRNPNYILTRKDLAEIRSNYNKKINQKYFRSYEVDLKPAKLSLRKSITDPYYIANASWFYDDYYYRSNLDIDPKAKDTIGYELELLQYNEVVKAFFSFNKKKNNLYRYSVEDFGSQMHLTISDTAYIAYTARPFNSIIYKLVRDSIQPIYQLVLPVENTMPETIVTNGFKSAGAWNDFQHSNANVLHSLHDIKSINNYLFFGIKFMRNYESFLLDRKTERIYKNKMIKADSSQYHIDLLQDGPGQYQNGYLYHLVSAEEVIEFYNNNRENDIFYPPGLEAHIRNARKDSNPLLIEYKLKQ